MFQLSGDDIFKVLTLLFTFAGMVLVAIYRNKQYLDKKFEELHGRIREMDFKIDDSIKELDIKVQNSRLIQAEMRVRVDEMWSRK